MNTPGTPSRKVPVPNGVALPFPDLAGLRISNRLIEHPEAFKVMSSTLMDHTDQFKLVLVTATDLIIKNLSSP